MKPFMLPNRIGVRAAFSGLLLMAAIATARADQTVTPPEPAGHDAPKSVENSKPATDAVGSSQHSGFAPHIGVGPGIRIMTPVGPVRLEYGVGKKRSTPPPSVGPSKAIPV